VRIGVSGHQSIPIEALSFVECGIEAILDRRRSGLIGLSSLAVGADQLFAAAVLRAGGRLHAVLPCRGYEETFKKSDDLHRYHAFIESAEDVEILDYSVPSEEAFLAAGKRIAAISDLLIAVWDGQPARGSGGTADIVAHAQAIGTPVEVVWPVGLSR
jgi:hypothetical protein